MHALQCMTHYAGSIRACALDIAKLVTNRPGQCAIPEPEAAVLVGLVKSSGRGKEIKESNGADNLVFKLVAFYKNAKAVGDRIHAIKCWECLVRLCGPSLYKPGSGGKKNHRCFIRLHNGLVASFPNECLFGKHMKAHIKQSFEAWYVVRPCTPSLASRTFSVHFLRALPAVPPIGLALPRATMILAVTWHSCPH